MAKPSADAASDTPITQPDASGTVDDAQLWKGRISRSEAAQWNFFTKCADWYDLLHARVQDNDFVWHSRYFDPVLAAKSWSLASKIVAGDSGWIAKPAGETDPMNAKAMEEALAYFERNPELDEPMREKYVIAAIDAVVCGIGYLKIPWTIKKKSSQSRELGDGGTIKSDKDGKPKVKKKSFFLRYPDALNMSVGDVLHSPSVSRSSIQKSPYVVFRSYVTKDELNRMSKSGVNYTNLEDVEGFGDFDPLTKARNRLILTQVDATIKMVEVHECWEKGLDSDGAECVYVTTIANRKVVIGEKKKSPFWHGKYPVAAFKIKPRGFSIEGEGIFETNERGQWAINDTTNHYFDAWNLSNNPMVIQEESTVVDSYEVMPGSQFIYRQSPDGSPPPQPFNFTPPQAQAYESLHQRVLASIETNSISGYQSGVPINASDRTQGTKGGTDSILQAGDDQLSFYRANFMEGVKEVGMQWMQLLQQYQDDPIVTEVMGKDGRKARVEITPDQIQGELNIDLSETALQSPNKQTDRQNFDMFVGQITKLLPEAANTGDPFSIDWTGLIKDMGEKYGAQGAEKYVKAMQPSQQAAPAPQAPPPPSPELIKAQIEAQKSPQQKLSESLQIKFSDLQPDVQNQLIKQWGLTPSQMLPQAHVDSMMNRLPTDMPDLSQVPPQPVAAPGGQ